MTTADQSRTKSTYSLQWNRYRIIRTEEDRVTFRNRTGLDEGSLQGKRVLDAGCGMGRYLKVAAELGAKVVGIDLSESVQAAKELATGPNVRGFARADLLQLPFRESSFDHIYSIGVIDHTPDPKRVFLELAKLLKPGGRIVIWVYQRERPILEAVINVHRAVSTRLPLKFIEALSKLTAPIGGLKRRLMASKNRFVSRFGVVLNLLTIGVSMHPDPEVRVCDTIDWYAPKYMSRHTIDEVNAWFHEAGLVDLVDLSKDQVFYHEGQGNGINVAGRRPSN